MLKPNKLSIQYTLTKVDGVAVKLSYEYIMQDSTTTSVLLFKKTFEVSERCKSDIGCYKAITLNITSIFRYTHKVNKPVTNKATDSQTYLPDTSLNLALIAIRTKIKYNGSNNSKVPIYLVVITK